MKMLLEEVKKLKVTELRAELRERGLDPRGLKAELVTRLISALEKDEQLKPTASKSVEEVELKEDLETFQTCAVKLNDKGTVATGSDQTPPKERHHTLFDANTPGSLQIWTQTRSVDQSTQTETNQAVTVSQTCCCSKRRSEESDRFETQDVHISHDRDLESSPAPITPLPHPDHTAVNKNDQSLATVTEETGVERLTSSKTVRRPHRERGRDYYEFKEEIQYIRAKTPEPGPVSEDEMDIDDDTVRLDSYNSDLHFQVGADGSSGQPLLWEKFPLLHSGCRLTHGFTQGKAGFEVKFVKRLSAAPVESSCSFDPEPYSLRVGWSVSGSSLQLGQDKLSFAYDGEGTVVTQGRKENFGEPFSVGDVIGCYAFISESGAAELSFSKNGHYLGVAFRLSPSTLGVCELYPHVLCKNCSISLNLDSHDKEWYPGPPGFCPLPRLPHAQQTRAPLPPQHRKDCEVLMMVGMPGSGKSHWAQSHMVKNSDNHYNMLSTDYILQCMSNPNIEHKELLLQQATQCLTHLIKIAANKRRNFILDQANIYPSAQRHKLLRFTGYKRRVVVVVPTDEEWKKRLQQKEQNEGAVIPELSLLKSKVSFTLPEQGDLLEEVLFVELCHEEAHKLLTYYKEEAGRLLPAPPKRKKHQNRPPKLHMDSSGWSQNSSLYAQQAQWGRHKQYGQHLSGFQQSYGCNSDPQQYRNYYQPYIGQWSSYNQNQNYYSNQVYYFGNQAFW